MRLRQPDARATLLVLGWGKRASRGARRERETLGLRIPALALVLVWSLGFEVMPLAHALEHAAAPGAEHCHDGTCHDDEDASGITASGHGDHTLAHRDVAAVTPGTAIVRWPVVVVADALDLPTFAATISTRQPSAATARGPPTT